MSIETLARALADALATEVAVVSASFPAGRRGGIARLGHSPPRCSSGHRNNHGPAGKCELVYKSGTGPTGTPNAAGTDVYRVAVRALSGGARAVQASILFIMTPPS